MLKLALVALIVMQCALIALSVYLITVTSNPIIIVLQGMLIGINVVCGYTNILTLCT